MEYFGGKPVKKQRAPSAYNLFVKDFAAHCKQSGKVFTMQDAAVAWKSSSNYVLPKSAGTLCKGVSQRDCSNAQSQKPGFNPKPCVWATPKKVNKKTNKVARPHCRASPLSKMH